MEVKISKVQGKILSEGFLAGFLLGVSIKTGKDIDETGIRIMVLNQTCAAFDNFQSSFNCYGMVRLVSFLVIIATFADTIRTIKMEKDWKTGTLIYIIGFILGLGLIVSTIK